MQNPSVENKSGAEKAEKTYQDQCRAQGQHMLPGKDHYRDHADKSVGHNKEQDKLQDFGIDHDRIPGIGADFGYHIRNAGPAARIVPEDQAVCKQVAGHTDYGAAEDKEKAHQHGRRTENPQPDQAVIQADESEQDHADPVKPHAAKEETGPIVHLALQGHCGQLQKVSHKAYASFSRENMWETTVSISEAWMEISSMSKAWDTAFRTVSAP